jgi:hypothetical protein
MLVFTMMPMIFAPLGGIGSDKIGTRPFMAGGLRRGRGGPGRGDPRTARLVARNADLIEWRVAYAVRHVKRRGIPRSAQVLITYGH